VAETDNSSPNHVTETDGYYWKELRRTADRIKIRLGSKRGCPRPRFGSNGGHGGAQTLTRIPSVACVILVILTGGLVADPTVHLNSTESRSVSIRLTPIDDRSCEVHMRNLDGCEATTFVIQPQHAGAAQIPIYGTSFAAPVISAAQLP